MGRLIRYWQMPAMSSARLPWTTSPVFAQPVDKSYVNRLSKFASSLADLKWRGVYTSGMNQIDAYAQSILPECSFTFSRSGGSGGQNVNKVNSAVQLRLDIRNCSLPDHIVTRLLAASDSRLTAEGELLIRSDSHRTQRLNKDECIRRLFSYFHQHLHIAKPRKKTRPGKAAVERRLKAKSHGAKKKQNRRRPDVE